MAVTTVAAMRQIDETMLFDRDRWIREARFTALLEAVEEAMADLACGMPEDAKRRLRDARNAARDAMRETDDRCIAAPLER